MSVRERWDDAARLIAENRDVLDARPGGGDDDALPALAARGWAAFLVSLDDAALAAVEIGGHEAEWPAGVPPSLLALRDHARRVCRLPPLAPHDARAPAARSARRAESARKHAQVDAFARVILPVAAEAARVVDVGSGHGHLTRAIAEQLALPVIGLEHNRALALRARALSSIAAPSAAPSFAVSDVLADGIPVADGDCLVGLHACGDLGDAMTESVARARASIALVGCCLQKIRAPSRRSLCESEHTGLSLPRTLLGLSNLTARDEGVEAMRSDNLAGRERRLALHRVLAEHGVELRLGAELEGLNRRAAQRDLRSLVLRVFELRGRAPPSRAAIEDAAAWARVQYARSRRLSLPRSLLARALEVFVLLDRARYLEERGFVVAVGTVFPLSASARNLVLVAKRRESRGQKRA